MTEPDLFATTTTGLPYPLPTAALNQGANDIKALALALDPRAPMRVIVQPVTSYTANAGAAAIPTGLASISGIALTPLSGNPVLITLSSLSGGTANVKVFNGTALAAYTGAFNVSWVAWGT